MLNHASDDDLLSAVLGSIRRSQDAAAFMNQTDIIVEALLSTNGRLKDSSTKSSRALLALLTELEKSYYVHPNLKERITEEVRLASKVRSVVPVFYTMLTVL